MGCVSAKTCSIIQINQRQEKPPFLLQTIDDHKLGVNCIEISDDRSLLVTGGEDCIGRLWSALSDPVECIGVLEGHTVMSFSFQFTNYAFY